MDNQDKGAFKEPPHCHNCGKVLGGPGYDVCWYCYAGKVAPNQDNQKSMGELYKEIPLGLRPTAIRQFETGATRDTDEGKPEYSGFNSPLVEKRFGQYMNFHQKQSDGTMRSSSNWKRGIPKDAYLQSMHRHFIDLWLHLDGFPEEAVEPDIEKVLCAIRFNVNGLLHEVLKEKAP